MLFPQVGGPSTPNFGFISFCSHDAVLKCLAAKPIFTADNHRLNVEEKKPKQKVSPDCYVD